MRRADRVVPIGPSEQRMETHAMPATHPIDFNSPVLPKRFWDLTQPTLDGCWIWTGATAGTGYGRISNHGVYVDTHRFVILAIVGELGSHQFVCHSCDIRSCVNPDHLWIGTHTDNVRDCVNKGRHKNSKKTHCPRGHLLSGGNVYLCSSNPTWRRCRECRHSVAIAK